MDVVHANSNALIPNNLHLNTRSYRRSLPAVLVLLALLVLGLASLLAQGAHAGSEANTQAKYAPETIAKFAKGVEHYAAKQGARAFIIGRVGRAEKDLPKGIEFTHTAVAIYSKITSHNGHDEFGYAIYNLYQTPENRQKSFLMTDYPVDFFWGAQVMKAGVLIPSAEVQQGLIKLVASGKHKSLHNPSYSVIANPFNTRFQNCTEFTLDMLNAAIYQSTDLVRIKQNTQAYFRPQTVRTSRFKLAMGSMFMSDVTISDHKGQIRTATFTSIAKYLEEYGLVKEASVLTLNSHENIKVGDGTAVLASRNLL
ncbi:DUF2145 domain-containing protein [Ningiella sp. W23]|uniref:DUF2145 domain-containing protein n=1 Tax=Ningiella sp. W23 TaxID=3023715 RepID=UPI003757D493